MTNREYIIDALAGEFGEQAYEDVANYLIKLPPSEYMKCRQCIKTMKNGINPCTECAKAWLEKEMDEVSE